MAYNSHLEGRIMSILNNHKRDYLTRRSLNYWVVTILLLGCMTLAGITLESCSTTDNSDGAATLSGAQQTATSPDTFVDVEKMPEMTYMENPKYPESAKKAGAEGEVWVKAFVNEEGAVTEAVVAETSGDENLDQAALDAALKNKFTPASKDGKPVGVWVTYKVMFELSDKEDSKT
jgi:TonB family protein